AAREAGARHVTVVVPYFGYARQDRLFFPGEAVSARALCRHVELGADAVITVDLHSPQTLEQFTKPAFEASGIPAIARLLRERPVDLLVSPDRGGIERVRRMAALLDKPWIAFEKKRIDSDHVELKLPGELSIPLAGKHAVLVDDVITTGGTMVEAAKLLRRNGAGAISVACT
ncbi:Phosphoribosyltransferase domain protein, partial [mine drainage metagenome]